MTQTAVSLAPPAGPPPHPWQRMLIEELHARPSAVVAAPARLLHLALITGEATADSERAHLAELCRDRGMPPPAAGAAHFAAACPAFQLTWERHTEFSTYTFVFPGAGTPLFPRLPDLDLPALWISGLAGEMIAAVQVEFLPVGTPTPDTDDLDRIFARGNVVGGLATGGRARLWTDFDLDAAGRIRLMIQDLGMSPRQSGRLIQRLLEVHTYCIMALLALPLAREVGPAVSRMERALADVAQALQAAATPEDEQALLKRLSALAAEVEGLATRTPYRFSAARAYHALVLRRTEELREERIEGQQTIGEFMDRRLAPAMRTCEAMQQRVDGLSQRVARAGEMLRTRVDVTLSAQNRDLLASMDRRARVQLQLQRTVEGLSVVAITYYAVGLIGYLSEGLGAAGLHLPKGVVVAIAVPVLALVAWLALRRLHRKLGRH
jgi:uncharacterized membrane-anchored protein